MKLTLTLLITLGWLSHVWAQGVNTPAVYSQRGTFTPPVDINGLEELNKIIFSETKLEADVLKRAKYYLLNGNVKMAKLHLIKVAHTHSKLRPIINRYLGILSFINGDYQESFTFLSQKELSLAPYYAKVCALKVLNQIILDIQNKLEDNWRRCILENPDNFVASNFIWLDTLVKLKLKPIPGITEVPFQKVKLEALSTTELKILLKLALYLNQEKLVLEEIKSLDVGQLQDTEVREIVGQILFRTGAFAQAYRFIEDLKSPNAENIKGNLYILRGKYELAYAQFKLALEQKNNSQNALERLVPLAWLLGDWKAGTNYTDTLMSTPETKYQKMTLHAAFLTQKGEFQQARRLLDTVSQRTGRGTHLDVSQLYSFIALMGNDKVDLLKSANQSCLQYDLLNCWTLFQVDQWGAFPLTMRRLDEVKHKSYWKKLVNEEMNNPLTETVYVNQLDIEEMDDKLIRLTPEQAP